MRRMLNPLYPDERTFLSLIAGRINRTSSFITPQLTKMCAYPACSGVYTD